MCRLTRFLLVASCVSLVVSACSDAGPVEPGVHPDAAYAKGGGTPAPDEVTVQAVDPDSTSQGVTLDIEVTGTGFDHTAAVALGVNGEASPAIITNSTTFLSETRLRANVTVAPDADTLMYDVIVSLSKGRKGIGTALFTVKPAHDSNAGGLSILLTAEFREAPGDRVLSDGAIYDDGGELQGGGRFWWQMERVRKGVTRVVCFDMPQPTWTSPDHAQDVADFDAIIGADRQFCSRLTFHTKTVSLGDLNWPGNPDGDPSVPTSSLVAGKLVLKSLATSKNADWEWRLLMDRFDLYDPIPDNWGAWVERLDEDTWTLEVGGEHIDSELELVRGVDGVLSVIATYDMPFKVTLRRR